MYIFIFGNERFFLYINMDIYFVFVNKVFIISLLNKDINKMLILVFVLFYSFHLYILYSTLLKGEMKLY
jgi:hypothetical protein